MTLEEYFGNWLRVIDMEELNRVVDTVNRLYASYSIMPAYGDIFRAFHLCSYDDLKAVFVGQDPYPQNGVATGILFGNREGTVQLSPSLEVVKDACIDFSKPHNPILFDVTLESWARQGILLLNSALTVQQDTPNSHTMLWRPFISKLLHNLSVHESGIVYVLFGKQAQTLRPYINATYNHVLEENHPAYYARLNKDMSPELFVKVNTLVESIYGKPFKWYTEL